MTDKFIRIRYTLSRAKQRCDTGKIMDVELEKIVPAHSIVRLYTNPYDHNKYSIRFTSDFPGSSGTDENMIFNLTKEQYDYVAAQLVDVSNDELMVKHKIMRDKYIELMHFLHDIGKQLGEELDQLRNSIKIEQDKSRSNNVPFYGVRIQSLRMIKDKLNKLWMES